MPFAWMEGESFPENKGYLDNLDVQKSRYVQTTVLGLMKLD